jgi:hypothetical protein
MLLVAAGLANVVVLETRWRRPLRGLLPDDPAPAGARLCAILSLAGWLCAAALGRLIAYF